MLDRLSALPKLLMELAADPTSNLTAAVLALAVLALLALLLVIALALFLIVLPSHPDESEESEADLDDYDDEPEGEEPRTAAEATEDAGPSGDEPGAPAAAERARVHRLAIPLWLLITAGAVLIVASSVWASWYSGGQTFCAGSCHHNLPEAPATASHATVGCSACHGSGRVISAGDGLWRMEHVVRASIGTSAPADPVHPATCRRCHADALTDVIESKSGIRMSHREPVRAGLGCADCHTTAGHGSAAVKGMSVCVRCHDGSQASAECGTCHLKDTSSSARRDYIYPQVRAANRNCGGCHTNQSKCDNCHGTRMPHSKQFREWGHAREAVFDGKKMCERCHKDYEDCGRCHSSFENGHFKGPHTLAQHKQLWQRESWDDPIVQCACHGGTKFRNFCAVCHDEAGSPFATGTER